MPRRSKGFTLIELMVTLVIIAILLGLAVPSYTFFMEKREVTRTAEEMAAFLNYAQSEAIKRNEQISVEFERDNHQEWCLGMTNAAAGCDCEQDLPEEDDFCAIDGTPMRMTNFDFVDPDADIMHRMRRNGVAVADGSLTFDPVRGVLTNFEDVFQAEIHTDTGSGDERLYELHVRVNMIGKVDICTDTGRQFLMPGFSQC